MSATHCCICSRKLSDPESVAVGIGPVCRDQIGFAALPAKAQAALYRASEVFLEDDDALRLAVRDLRAAGGEAADAAAAVLEKRLGAAAKAPVDLEERQPDEETGFWPEYRQLHAPVAPPAPDGLTDGQKQAFDAAMLGMRRGAVVVIQGYAGVGKTYLLRMLQDALPEQAAGLVALAPTGRAALRMRTLSGLPGQTIHRWCFQPVEDPKTGDVSFKYVGPRLTPAGGSGVVLDEASMVGRQLWDAVETARGECHCGAVLVGDGFQLAPVEKLRAGVRPFSIMSKGFPASIRVELTQIVRQKEGNPVIEATLALRKGDVKRALSILPTVSPGKWRDVAVRMLGREGAVICHTNNLRRSANLELRGLLGFPSSDLADNERLVCTRNNYAVGLYNGELFNFVSWIIPPDITSAGTTVHNWQEQVSGTAHFGLALIRTEAGHTRKAVLCLEAIAGAFAAWRIGDKPVAAEARHWSFKYAREHATSEERFVHGRWIRVTEPAPYLGCEFGHVLTCHKMQGSQARHVLVLLEQSVRLGQEEGRRWLYTAATRAERHVGVCRL